MDMAIVGVLVVSLLCVLLSIAFSLKLTGAHLRKGQELSGNIIPLKRSVDIAQTIMAIPIFSLISCFMLLTPESASLWHFLLTVVISSVMAKLPLFYIDSVGFGVLIQHIQQYQGEPLRLYGNKPLCCIRPCSKVKKPELSDIRNLKIGVYQFGVIQPFIAFVEVFLAVESAANIHWVDILSGRKLWLTILKIGSNLVAMSSIAGLATLCESTHPNDKEACLRMSSKRSYAQSFLLGMNLIPALMHGVVAYFLHNVTLSTGRKMSSQDQTLWSTAAMVCIASVFISRTAYKSFPVDEDALYAEDKKVPLLEASK